MNRNYRDVFGLFIGFIFMIGFLFFIIVPLTIQGVNKRYSLYSIENGKQVLIDNNVNSGLVNENGHFYQLKEYVLVPNQ